MIILFQSWANLENPIVYCRGYSMARANMVWLWVAFAFFLHRWLFGVAPFG